jgi:type IV fimbrial biogenesis protein FimT
MNARAANVQRGFTLLELVVGVAILALLVVLAMPSYTQWLINSRVRTTSESIQNGLRYARNQAVDLALPVRFELSGASSSNWTVCVPASATSSCSGVTTQCSSTTLTTCLLKQYVSQYATYSVALGTSAGTGGSFSSALTSFPVAGVTFDALGRPTDYNNTSLGRVDISSVRGTRRLVDTVNSAGAVRQCDANLPLSANTPEGCS